MGEPAKGANLAQADAPPNTHLGTKQAANNSEERGPIPPKDCVSSVSESSVAAASQKAKKKIVRKKSFVDSVKSVQKGKSYFKLLHGVQNPPPLWIRTLRNR